MNRRSFFQRMAAGIGALVGYKYLPKTPEPTGFDAIAVSYNKGTKSAEKKIKLHDPYWDNNPIELFNLPCISCECTNDSPSSYTITIWGISCTDDNGNCYIKILGQDESTDVDTDA